MRKHCYKDLTNKKFGRLIAISYSTTKNKRAYWNCVCECGKVVEKNGKSLLSGLTKSCGCLGKRRVKDLSGLRFNYLTIIKIYGQNKRGEYLYECLCDCGNHPIIVSGKLKSGHTKSCGCLLKRKSSERALIRNKIMIGVKHPKWDFSLTKEDRSGRVSNPKIYRWRNKVFKRDDFTCQICKDNKGGNLEAHHIFSWNTHKNLRYLKSNGITLCEDCHKKFHMKFGYGNNTKKQFILFSNIYLT